MARIDDPAGKLREHYLETPKSPISRMTEVAEALPKEVPVVGWVLGKVMDFIKSDDKEAKLESFNNHIVEFYEALGKDVETLQEQLTSPEHVQMVAVAVERIFWGANERKVRRFAAVVSNAIALGETENDFEDAASFIRALAELSETDITVLKLLYDHQGHLVVENHVVDYNSFFQNDRWRNLSSQVGPLGIQMDDFYARCARLNGYGLVLPLESRTHNFGPSEFAFRITIIGKRLIEMLITHEGASGAEPT